jgi:hypothetical protein
LKGSGLAEFPPKGLCKFSGPLFPLPLLDPDRFAIHCSGHGPY